MMKLFEREGCPYCRRVRRALEARGVPYEAVPVPKLGTERTAVLALPGVTSPEIPVLVDGDTVIQGSDAIVEHLRALRTGFFGDPAYGLTRVLPGTAMSDAIPAVRAALAAEGFGVLTEIDVRATLDAKLGVDFRPYVILGACNPPIAHQALTAEPGVGLLLPCNVVVTEEDDGSAVVSTIDPARMFEVVGRPGLEPLVGEVGDRLRRVLTALS